MAHLIKGNIGTGIFAMPGKFFKQSDYLLQQKLDLFLQVLF